jgi:hypothetical protein
MSRNLSLKRIGLARAPHWLALLAMLLQFVASYGHLHPQDFNALLHGHGATMVVSYNGPIANGDSVAPDIDCPICSSMQILGSSALPDGVRLSLPSSQHATTPARFEAFDLTPPRHLLFDTRGPPQA